MAAKPEALQPLAESSSQWQQTLQQAKGQSVYFNAWGGSEAINDHIRWVAKQIKIQYGIQLKHVKVDDIAPVVSRILTEKQAGKISNGSVDMVWINGENFRAMKNKGLLFGPFSNQLPATRYMDLANRPSLTLDFGEPVDGMEAPWGKAQLVFVYNSKRVKQTPQSITDLLQWSSANPGRFTYPAPPAFLGTTFLKQVLTELTEQPNVLQAPVTQANFTKVTAPLWKYLDQLHPQLWRKGRDFPTGGGQLFPLMDDGELDISFSFNPNAASNAIAQGELADNTRSFVMKNGSIGNTHFLAIPFNAEASAAAQVVINFMQSPDAQLNKANPEEVGDPTILAINALPEKWQKKFAQLPLGVATLRPEQLGKTLPEPHASWVEALEQAWLERYR
ncbi:ABC transporter substrate-binding protein [Pelagibaculum spongiae]|uniref:ABC transporter substrate-binding protein n=1 Tax=Pelagibaculum spongiae TaxID=2080658 RepID=A0A2V1H433_9GAMM|nr:ABC transporter substrate-binding protein [Pelagibaculum spongiae]PVZ71947.1 ABC transporter substrate-binding protein [Pelagibaculum spongiae]